jgi:ABC-type Zn2+ transport system substrate-binding protein/surface adhesin
MTHESTHQHHHDHHHQDGHDHEHAHRSGIRGILTQIFVPHSHDAADSVDTALETSAVGIRAVKISLIGLGATAAVQVVIALVSGSVALAADTIHNS